MPNLTLHVRRDNETSARVPSAATIRATAIPQLVARGLTGKWQLDCSFVTTATMRQLHKAAQGYDTPTDVLSFPVHFATNERDPHSVLPPSGLQLLGSIVIATDVARDQAHAAGVSLRTELVSLVDHAVHHLLGLDHDDAAHWQDRAKHDHFSPRTDVITGN